MSITRFNFFKC